MAALGASPEVVCRVSHVSKGALAADSSCWLGTTLSADPGSWRCSLSAVQLAELHAVLELMRGRQISFHRVQASQYPLPSLAPLVAEIRHELNWGQGFIVLSGFPTHHSEEDTERLF
eukprot:COSAG05_NODE_10776_length_547_cov_0.810268_1_plen_116_part_01